MTAFEKWKGFIEQLIYFECPANNEKSRLQAELSVMENINGAEVFQAIYDAWHILNIKGVHSYITGEAEQWFIFYFLDMARENPINRELPTQIPSKIKAKRVALTWRLPENTYEMVEG